MQVQLKKQLHPAEIFSGRNSKKKVWISMNCWTVYCSYKCAFLYLKDEVINIPTSLSTLKNKGMYPLYYQCFKKLFFLIKIFIIEIYFYFFFFTYVKSALYLSGPMGRGTSLFVKWYAESHVLCYEVLLEEMKVFFKLFIIVRNWAVGILFPFLQNLFKPHKKIKVLHAMGRKNKI